MKKKIIFVIPCYNSSQTLEKVVEEIKETMINLPHIFLFALHNCSITSKVLSGEQSLTKIRIYVVSILPKILVSMEH